MTTPTDVRQSVVTALLPEEVARFAGTASQGRAAVFEGVVEAATAAAVAGLALATDRPVLVVTGSATGASQLHGELSGWIGSERPVLLFPAPEAQPFERLIGDAHVTSQRVHCLLSLARGESPVVVTTAGALIQATLSVDEVRARTRLWRRGDRLLLQKTLATWLQHGYEPASLVEEPGTFSRRGGVIDIYPIAAECPYRLELLGDEIESIRTFDPASQRSAEEVEEVLVPPAREAFPPLVAEALGELRGLPLSSLREDVRARWEADVEEMAAGNSVDGIEFFRAYLSDLTFPLQELQEKSLVVFINVTECEHRVETLIEESEQARRDALAIGDIPPGLRRPYRMWSEALQSLNELRTVLIEQSSTGIEGLSHPAIRDFTAILSDVSVRSFAVECDLVSPLHFANRFRLLTEHLHELLDQGFSVAIGTPQADRVQELLESFDLPVRRNDRLADPWSSTVITTVQAPVEQGWQSQSLHVALFTDTELFGQQAQRTTVRRPQVDRAFLAELQTGDYIVHVEHGVGRYVGIVTRDFGAGMRDYIHLEYQGNDSLFVPTDQLHNVTRYVGVGEQAPKLNRLGSAEWARTKEHARKAARDIAADLLRLYAIRTSRKGFAFPPDNEWQREMEAAFPHVETPDQLRAVEDVKADMERPRIMDRLVCGDVGYGKTEVALRAAFKAAISGKQVALLVPTTVLAEQHFLTFKKRFENFPVRVELLSRFRSRADQSKVVVAINEGKVEIVVGTHRLLQQDVQFAHLGLVIIDEEQRFGVEHKERLKQLRQEVDVLTLTATPIPRTLNMSLAGLRDLSVIDTPPEERLPVKTFITQEDERLIRSAILRELDRHGQVYFLHNRVQTIDVIASRLRELVPEATIGIAHGQMAPDRLERVMRDFAGGKVDLLLCTVIIENGLDIPNANTIIIDRATHLGLAQLYQLRGRVGRSNRRAYAYLLHAKGGEPSETAKRRLRAIFEASELGAGFKIAMRDLEIRGAGDLLGAAQSGHVGAVGFHLYTQMLAEEVDKLRGVPEQTPLQVVVELPVGARLPDDYIGDESAKVDLYRRLAALSTLEEVEHLRQELRDRFGPLPEPADNLITIVEVKARAAVLGIPLVTVKDGELTVKLPSEGILSRSAIYRTYGAAVKLTPSQLRLPLKVLGNDWIHEVPRLLDRLASRPVAVLRPA
ncbi:MAG: transcription-repair coupling factor [Chloroflexi bacterium]|nr:transcription-repair coupling factor [Chloroflexota bacterium]